MSQSGIYSELKPAWWYMREGGLPEAPKQVQLILSDLCNQDCHFCAYRMSGYSSNQLFMQGAEPAKYGHNNPLRWIPKERALSLLMEMQKAGVLSIQFTGGGEPTVHPDHEEIFEMALKLGFRCSLVSNGVKWSDHLIEYILPQFDWVRVSIDSASPKSYSKIRRTPEAHFDKAWRHVEDLNAAICMRQSKTTMGCGFVVTPESYKEIPEFALLAYAHGAENVRYTAMFSTEGEKALEGIYDEAKALIQKARQHESATFTVHDNFGSRFEDLKQHAPDYEFCGYQHYTTYIGADLRLYRCCVLAYNERGLVEGGDLRTRNFAEFWDSKERQDDMNALDARGCERCQFNTKNRTLNYMRNNNPPHKEWP